MKTARELAVWIALLEIADWFLIRLITGWLVVLGWCLAAAGVASLVVWICMGLIQAPSPKPPKPGPSPVKVIFKFILIPLLIVGIVGLVATVFKKTEPAPPNKDLFEHINRVWRTLVGRKG